MLDTPNAQFLSSNVSQCLCDRQVSLLQPNHARFAEVWSTLVGSIRNAKNKLSPKSDDRGEIGGAQTLKHADPTAEIGRQLPKTLVSAQAQLPPNLGLMARSIIIGIVCPASLSSHPTLT